MAGQKSYNKDVAESILDKVAQGEPLTRILNSNTDFPPIRTWFSWLQYVPTLRAAYQAAKAAGLNQINESIFTDLDKLEDYISDGNRIAPNSVGLGKIELKFKYLQWQTGVKLGARISGLTPEKQIKSILNAVNRNDISPSDASVLTNIVQRGIDISQLRALDAKIDELTKKLQERDNGKI